MIDQKNVIKPNETPILFVNFRDKEFIGYWDKKEIKLAPKETRWMPYWLATHCAKILVDDEMNTRKLATDHFSRESYVAKCIGNKPPEDGAQDNDPLGLEILNRNMEELSKKKAEPETQKEEKPRKEKKKKIGVEVEEDSFEGK